MDALNGFIQSLHDQARQQNPTVYAVDMFFHDIRKFIHELRIKSIPTDQLQLLIDHESAVRSWLLQRHWKNEHQLLNPVSMSRHFFRHNDPSKLGVLAAPFNKLRMELSSIPK